MGTLVTQERLQQNRGVIKVADGVHFLEINSDGSINTVDSTVRTEQRFKLLLVRDNTAVEALNEVVKQLRIVSRKLDCLQPNDEELDETEFDNVEGEE